MAFDSKKYIEFLKEQLELSGVELSEADSDDEDFKSMPMPDVGKEEEPEEEPKEKDSKEEKPKEKDEEPKTELTDSWEINIGTSGKLKFDMHENYLFVWYRNKRSDKIMIPSKLKQNEKLVSELFNKVLSHVEKVS